MPTPLPVHQLKTNAKEIRLESGQKAYHLPDWNQLSHPQRLEVIRQIAMMRGRDPRIAKLALKIFRQAGAKPREYVSQAKAILKWVQDPKNIYYVNEPGERLQDPIYTINTGHGDCDDMVLVLGALYETVGLPWRLCLSGRGLDGKKIRYIEGEPVPAGAKWAHIYAMVGDRPFRPSKWYFAEPTVQGVPLGWDVVSGDASYLPEMAKQASKGPAKIVVIGKAPKGYRPKALPPAATRSPAYDMAYGSALVPMAVGSSIAEAVDTSKSSPTKTAFFTEKLLPAIVTGVAVSVGTTLVLDFINGTGMWKSSGSLLERMKRSWSLPPSPATQTVTHAPTA